MVVYMFVYIVTTTIEIDHVILIHGQKRKSIHYMVCIYIYSMYICSLLYDSIQHGICSGYIMYYEH
jgi:hypothetical protein